jgi:hypothetical protein
MLGKYLGRSGRAEHERTGCSSSGLAGLSADVQGGATAVQLSGEGDGDKEERLVLRVIGGRDRPGRGCVRAGRG